MSASAEPRSRFRRIEAPTPEEFAEAAEVCYTRWPYMRELDSPARFRAFQQLHVELCALNDSNGAMQCVGYLVPSQIEAGGETLTWYYMFQVASRPDAAGAGSLLVRQIMKWYPAIFGMGITPDAEKLYQAFQWRQYPGFWRGVHLLNIRRFVKDYGSRIGSEGKKQLLSSTAGLGNLAGAIGEAALSLGSTAAPWRPDSGKGAAVGAYLGLYAAGDVRAADVGGTARLLTRVGAGSLRQHAAVWRALRKRGARLCEVLLYSEEDRRRALRRGYIPIPLQVWCWDKQGILARAIPALCERGFSFFDTDKVI
jgi:hypothetical protein